jgi:hypothetical protein
VDVGQIEELRAWAARLEERTEDDELRAAARAILMLAEEVEDLRARLVVASLAAPPAAEEAGPATDSETERGEATRRSTGTSFLSRVKRAFGLE